MTEHIEIIEVGPRDGLQRESTFIPTKQKITMTNALSEAGLSRIQVTSFVHPKWVPQLADAEDVCAGIERKEGVIYSGLVLNMKGLERAQAAGLNAVDMSVSASDSHSHKNTNQSLEESLSSFERMVSEARNYGMHIRGGIQCAFGYYESDVTQKLVVDLARQHLDLGIDELALADSTGMANPRQIRDMLEAIFPLTGDKPVILHLHDTRGMGLANVVAALEAGCTYFDTSFGGLGGCNFIAEATGNIATEDTIYMLHQMGYSTGVDVTQVAAVSRKLQDYLGEQAFPGKMYRLLETTTHERTS
jgi:hydroxymethylglutaryl-CoA lyase